MYNYAVIHAVNGTEIERWPVESRWDGIARFKCGLLYSKLMRDLKKKGISSRSWKYTTNELKIKDNRSSGSYLCQIPDVPVIEAEESNGTRHEIVKVDWSFL